MNFSNVNWTAVIGALAIGLIIWRVFIHQPKKVFQDIEEESHDNPKLQEALKFVRAKHIRPLTAGGQYMVPHGYFNSRKDLVDALLADGWQWKSEHKHILMSPMGWTPNSHHKSRRKEM